MGNSINDAVVFGRPVANPAPYTIADRLKSIVAAVQGTLITSRAPITLTSRSLAFTLGGTAQTLTATAGKRIRGIGNPDPAEDIWLEFLGGTGEPNGQSSILIPPGGTWTFDDENVTTVSLYAATTGHKIAAWEG